MPLNTANHYPEHSSDAAPHGSSLHISEGYLSPAFASRFGLPSTEYLYQSLVETGLSPSNANELRSVYKVFLQAVDMQITKNNEPALTTSLGCPDPQKPLSGQCNSAEASNDNPVNLVKAELESISTSMRSALTTTPSTDRLMGAVRSPRKGKFPKNLGSQTVAILCDAFRANSYPDQKEKNRLASATGLTYKQVHSWFQNRRYRCKKTPWLRSRLLGDKINGEPRFILPDRQKDLSDDCLSLHTSPSVSAEEEQGAAPYAHGEDGNILLSNADSRSPPEEITGTLMTSVPRLDDQTHSIRQNHETQTHRTYFEKFIDVPADTPPVTFSTDSSTFLDIFNPLGPNDDKPINRPYPSVYMPFDVEDRPFSSATRSTVNDKQLFSFPQTLWKRTDVHDPSSYVPTKQDYKSLFHSFKGLALGATQRSDRHRSTGARRRRVIAHH
ncbi:hypothetical protein SISSUDRAFT_1057285 [Sistotremastrum suecicum HHB10207 ss-3]|uniref:Homeobox domain-containing protein n=1 Tax=Sistotremastrum suecicum HHB10207 ss-3 TaxID=1314776 RepID=A0A166IH51_9AGAM|nr:hypothetical protein SISSUDRAFT_1057285 [Sistotremastrum suecicum HHB10207 ss-3]